MLGHAPLVNPESIFLLALYIRLGLMKYCATSLKKGEERFFYRKQLIPRTTESRLRKKYSWGFKYAKS